MVSGIKREDPSVRGLSYISTTTYTAQHGSWYGTSGPRDAGSLQSVWYDIGLDSGALLYTVDAHTYAC